MGKSRAPGGGRKPLPTAIKEHRGTLRADRSNPNAPKLPCAIPPCPDVLQGEARRQWRRLARQLYDMRILTPIDTTALTACCACWARFVDAEEKLRQHGPVVIGPSGFPVMSPYLSISTKAIDQMTRLLVEFGMTPSSRTRVSASTPMDDGPDPLDEFFSHDPVDPLTKFLEQ